MYEDFSRQTFVIWQQNMLIARVDLTRIQVKLSFLPQLRKRTMAALKTNDKILHDDNCIWIQNKFITFKISRKKQTKYIFVIENIKLQTPNFYARTDSISWMLKKITSCSKSWSCVNDVLFNIWLMRLFICHPFFYISM